MELNLLGRVLPEMEQTSTCLLVASRIRSYNPELPPLKDLSHARNIPTERMCPRTGDGRGDAENQVNRVSLS